MIHKPVPTPPRPAVGWTVAVLCVFGSSWGIATGSGVQVTGGGMTAGGGRSVGARYRVVGGVETGMGGGVNSRAWVLRAGVVARLRNATLPPLAPVTLAGGPQLFGVGGPNVTAASAGLLENGAYVVRWNPTRDSRPDTLKYEYQTQAPTSSPTFSGPLELGRGYWYVGTDQVTYAVRPPNESQVEVDLRVGSSPYQGWNIIANPFMESVSLAQQQLRLWGSPAGSNANFGSSEAAQLVDPSLWGYPVVDAERPNLQGYQLYSLTYPDALTTIPANAGVWVLASTDVTWVWTRPSKQTSGRSSVTTTVASRQPSREEWMVRLSVRAGPCVDRYNYFGVGAGSRVLRNPPPAAAQEFVDLRFLGRGRAPASLAADLVPLSRAPLTLRWPFVVEARVADENVVLSWPNLSGVPRDVRLFLVDLDSGRQTYMRTSSNYAYRPAGRALRQFEIRAERNGAAALRITGITTRPTRGGALELSYVLSRPATVRVRLTTPAGRLVDSSAFQSAARSGVNRMTWVPRRQGRLLSPGFYLIEIIARTEDGRVAKGLSAVRLGR